VESSCKLGNEPSGSINMLGIYRMAAQLVASRVVLSFTELVSFGLFVFLKFVGTSVMTMCPHVSSHVWDIYIYIYISTTRSFM
jgi:hypothetical protein